MKFYQNKSILINSAYSKIVPETVNTMYLLRKITCHDIEYESQAERISIKEERIR